MSENYSDIVEHAKPRSVSCSKTNSKVIIRRVIAIVHVTSLSSVHALTVSFASGVFQSRDVYLVSFSGFVSLQLLISRSYR